MWGVNFGKSSDMIGLELTFVDGIACKGVEDAGAVVQSLIRICRAKECSGVNWVTTAIGVRLMWQKISGQKKSRHSEMDAKMISTPTFYRRVRVW